MSGVSLQPSGHTPPPVTNPSLVRALGKSRVDTIKTVGGVIILGVLAAGYLAALFCGKETSALLAIVASGVGYLLGGRSSSVG
jgi:hypothetical protein